MSPSQQNVRFVGCKNSDSSAWLLSREMRRAYEPLPYQLALNGFFLAERVKLHPAGEIQRINPPSLGQI